MRFKVVGFVKYSLDQEISERKLGKLKSVSVEIQTSRFTPDTLDDRLAETLSGWKFETSWFSGREDLPSSESIYSEAQFYALGHSMSAQEADPLNLPESEQEEYLERSSAVIAQELGFWNGVIRETYETGLEQEQSLFDWEPLQEFPELHSPGLYLDRIKLTDEGYTSLESLYGDGFPTRMVGAKFSRYPYSEFESDNSDVISIPPGILLAVPLLVDDQPQSRPGFISSKMGGRRSKCAISPMGVPLNETSFRCVQVTLGDSPKKSSAEFMKTLRAPTKGLTEGNPETMLKVYLLKRGSLEEMGDLDSRLTELVDRKRACDQRHRNFIHHTLMVGSTHVDGFECTICGSPKVTKKIALLEHSANGVLMVCSQECESVLDKLSDLLKDPKPGKRKLAAATSKVKIRAHGIAPQHFEVLRSLKIKQVLGTCSPEDLRQLSVLRSKRPQHSNESSQSKEMFYTTTAPATVAHRVPEDMTNGVFLSNELPSQLVSFASLQPLPLSQQEIREFSNTTNSYSLVNVWKLQ